MRFDDLLLRTTKAPLESEMGESACFHEGNRISITKWYTAGEPDADPDEDTCVTVAEVWPASDDIDKYDGARMVHSYNKFPVLLDGLRKALSYRMQTHHGDDPCIVMLKAIIKDAEEVEGI